MKLWGFNRQTASQSITAGMNIQKNSRLSKIKGSQAVLYFHKSSFPQEKKPDPAVPIKIFHDFIIKLLIPDIINPSYMSIYTFVHRIKGKNR